MTHILLLVFCPLFAVPAGDPDPFLMRVRTDAVDGYILKGYPCYASVLHDMGVRVDDRFQYIYGWWASAAPQVDGAWRNMSAPDFVLDGELTASQEGPWTVVNGAVKDADSPGMRILTSYWFRSDLPGVRIAREYAAQPDGSTWGPSGQWIGGPSGWFPTHERETPSTVYAAGAWLTSPPSAPVDAPYALYYWDKTGVWLLFAIERGSLAAPFKAPRLSFSGPGISAPGWIEETGTFISGKIAAWYFMGKSSREEAVRTADAIVAPLTSGAWDPNSALPYTAPPAAPPEIKPVSAPVCTTINQPAGKASYEIDPTTFTISNVILNDDNITQISLPPGARISFGAGSGWQRPLDWENRDERELLPSETTMEAGQDASAKVNSLLRDPETREAICKVALDIRLTPDGDAMELKAAVEPLTEAELPYLGWRFDMPAGAYRWVSTGGWTHDILRWSNYRMSFMDRQPMRPIVNTTFMEVFPAAPDKAVPSFRLEFTPDTQQPRNSCHMPNPLFDRPGGYDRFVMSASETYWNLHNTTPVSIAPGTPLVNAVRLSLLPQDSPPALPALFPVFTTPKTPETAKALNEYLGQRCLGGPAGTEAISALWYALAGRFNPRMAFAVWRMNLADILAKASDGTVVTGGFTVPRGGLPNNALGVLGWNGGFLFDNNGHVILSSEQYALASGDLDFLRENITRLEAALAFYLDMTGPDGLATLPAKFNGIDQNCSTCYWDGWQIGHKAALFQMHAAASAQALARMEKALGREDESTRYANEAVHLREALIKEFWRDGGLKDNSGAPISGGRLATWRTADGHLVDAGFTDLSLQAAWLGLLDGEQTRKVLAWLDDDPHAYTWKDSQTGEKTGCVTINTVDGNNVGVYPESPGPKRYYAGPFNPFNVPPGMQNGQVMQWVAGFDWCVRARNGMGAGAAEKLMSFTRRFARDGLTAGHGIPESRPLPMFQGTTQMSPLDIPCGSDQALSEDALLIGLGVMTGLFGLEADYTGLRLAPCLPVEFADATLSNCRYQQHDLAIQYHGYGDQIIRVEVNGQEVTNLPYVLPFTKGAAAMARVATRMDVYMARDSPPAL